MDTAMWPCSLTDWSNVTTCHNDVGCQGGSESVDGSDKMELGSLGHICPDPTAPDFFWALKQPGFETLSGVQWRVWVFPWKCQGCLGKRVLQEHVLDRTTQSRRQMRLGPSHWQTGFKVVRHGFWKAIHSMGSAAWQPGTPVISIIPPPIMGTQD